MREHYETRAERFRARYQRSDDGASREHVVAMVRLEHALMDAEVAAVVQLYDQGIIGEEVVRQLHRELDLERLRIGVDGAGLH